MFCRSRWWMNGSLMHSEHAYCRHPISRRTDIHHSAVIDCFCNWYKVFKTSCAEGSHNTPPPYKLTFDLLTLKVAYVSHVWRGLYVCANFSLPRTLCSRLRPDVRDRQTSDAHLRLMPPPYGGGGIIMDILCFNTLLNFEICMSQHIVKFGNFNQDLSFKIFDIIRRNYNWDMRFKIRIYICLETRPELWHWDLTLICPSSVKQH